MNSLKVICLLVSIGVCHSSILPSYGIGGGSGNGRGTGNNGGAGGGAGTGSGSGSGEGAGGLEDVIPGIPGQDYPILTDIPDTSFTCEGKVEAGYYADTEAQCQLFHVCIADGEGGLAKTSFLCHNGTIFNQELFTCDLWANFDCSSAEGLYSKNEELAAARAAATAAANARGAGGAGGAGGTGGASGAGGSSGAGGAGGARGSGSAGGAGGARGAGGAGQAVNANRAPGSGSISSGYGAPSERAGKFFRTFF